MDNTIEYYNQNAEQFVRGTISVDFATTQERFIEKLSAGVCILDFDRNCIMQKKELESTNAKWNEYLNERSAGD